MKYKILCTFLLIFVHTFAQNKSQSVGFKENKGQIIDQKGKPNPDVKFLLNTNGLNVQIKTNGFSYDIYETKKHPIKHNKKEKPLSSTYPETDKEKSPDCTLEYIYHRIDIDFVNFNPKTELVTEQKSKDYDNYYNIPNKPDGVLNVHQYQQITYKNIYPNIDVIFSIPKDSLKAVEYNFVVHPKGKISDIQLKFNGAKTELVDNKIKMQVRFGEMEETLPLSWTEDGKSKKEIHVGYTKIKKNIYGFASAENVSGKTVVIDPVPTRLWGTYYGGENIEFSSYVFTKNGFVYWAGTTYSSNNIASSGAHQNSNSNGAPFQGPYDSFFTKLNSDGTRVWGTYYGGGYADKINQVKVSDNDNIYIVGSSLSGTNISSLGSHQSQKGLYWDGFLAKFDSNGLRKWATYYGGEDNEEAYSLSLDSNEKIYISGETISVNSIATIGSHQPIHANQGADSFDGFIAKFNSNGVREWGTYYGGNGRDAIFDSKLDSSGNLIFLGSSYSAEGISTSNSYQEINNAYDGFLVKFDPNGNRIWGTYFGGNNNDFFFNLGIDSNDNLYCFGQTNSTLNIATTGVFQEVYQQNNINTDGCIFKFDPNGFKTWGSYFFPGAYGGSVSKKGDIYFTGIVENGFEATPKAYLEFQNSGNETTYLVKFNTNGQRDWATYFGGNGADYTNITAVDDDFNIYLAGATSSLNNIATPNTYQPYFYYVPFTDNNHLNSLDAFLVKFKDCLSSVTASSNSPICIGKTLELKASGGTNYVWTGPNGFTSVLQNPTIPNATAANSGQYSCAITGTGDCDDTKTVDVIVGDTAAPIPTLTTLPTISGDCHTQITTIPTATDACAGAITASTTSPLSYSLPGTYIVVWNYNDGNGNSFNQNQTVSISSEPLPTTTSPQTFCIQQSATLSSISITGENIKWYDASTNGNLLNNTSLLQNGITYYASQTINGCESERTSVLINIQNTLAPTGNSTQTFCSAQNPTIANLIVTGNAIKWFDSLNNGSLLTQTTNLVNGKTYYASQTTTNCESERFGVSVSIVNTPSAPTANTNQSFCKKENATLNTIQITGQNIKWYDTNSAVTTLPTTTLLENNKTYYASQTIGCESGKTEILIQVYDTPLPTGSTNQQFCLDENATLSNFNIAGANIKWYDELTNGTVLAETTLLQNGKTYYATQTLNNCESDRVAVFVKIQDTPIPIANSPQTFCVQKNAKISDISIVGQNINWFENASSTIKLSESTLLEYGITYYASQSISNCESDKIPISITILEATKGDCINFVDELPYSKFFTPNNDGHNDYWSINFTYLKPNSEIQVFDRYGKLIKTLTSNSSNWNGTFNGAELPSTDYWFVVTRANGIVYKGHFSLKR